MATVDTTFRNRLSIVMRAKEKAEGRMDLMSGNAGIKQHTLARVKRVSVEWLGRSQYKLKIYMVSFNVIVSVKKFQPFSISLISS